jgi:hypothetical protein
VTLIENKRDMPFSRLEIEVECKYSYIVYNLTFQQFALPCSAGVNENEFPVVISKRK